MQYTLACLRRYHYHPLDCSTLLDTYAEAAEPFSPWRLDVANETILAQVSTFQPLVSEPLPGFLQQTPGGKRGDPVYTASSVQPT